MELYSRTIMPFDAYLDVRNQGTANEAIASATRYQLASLNRGFGAVVANQKRMTAVMALGFGAVTQGISQVNRSIETLRSDFNWAMGEVLSKLEMQGQALQEIAVALQAPLATQAKELRKRAQFAYQNGWYEEALGDFLEAEKQNYQDFIVHHAIGNIYLYHERPANLKKARNYYLKAAKYALPVSKYDAALAYMYGGFVCYLQNDNAAAIQNAAVAANTYPNLVEAFFNHAKFAASAGFAKIAIPSLEYAIRCDRHYAVKARADSDFEPIEGAIAELIHRLYIESRKEAETKLRELQALEPNVRPNSAKYAVRGAMSSATASLDANTYFGNLDASHELRQVWHLKNKVFYDPELTVAGDSMVVGKDKIVLRGLKPVSVMRKGWSKAVYYFELKNKSGDVVYRISSEDKGWIEDAAYAVNQVIRSLA